MELAIIYAACAVGVLAFVMWAQRQPPQKDETPEEYDRRQW